MLTVTVNLSKHVTDAYYMYHINKRSFDLREANLTCIDRLPFPCT